MVWRQFLQIKRLLSYEQRPSSDPYNKSAQPTNTLLAGRPSRQGSLAAGGPHSQWCTQKIFIGSVSFSGIWYPLGAWCALFVTSQFDFTFMFLNQRFGESCWHDVQILLHALSLYQRSMQVKISEENTLNATTQQFILQKYQTAH